MNARCQTTAVVSWLKADIKHATGNVWCSPFKTLNFFTCLIHLFLNPVSAPTACEILVLMAVNMRVLSLRCDAM
jgi:hypothetical protein